MSPAKGHRVPKSSPALEDRGRPMVVRPGGNVDDVDEFDFDAVVRASLSICEGTAKADFAAGGFGSYASIGRLVNASAGSVEHWLALRREPSFAWKIVLGYALGIAEDRAEERATRHAPRRDDSAPESRLRGFDEGEQ